MHECVFDFSRAARCAFAFAFAFHLLAALRELPGAGRMIKKRLSAAVADFVPKNWQGAALGFVRA